MFMRLKKMPTSGQRSSRTSHEEEEVETHAVHVHDVQVTAMVRADRRKAGAAAMLTRSRSATSNSTFRKRPQAFIRRNARGKPASDRSSRLERDVQQQQRTEKDKTEVQFEDEPRNTEQPFQHAGTACIAIADRGQSWCSCACADMSIRRKGREMPPQATPASARETIRFRMPRPSAAMATPFYLRRPRPHAPHPTGIQSTGIQHHLGNMLGAIEPAIAMSNDGQRRVPLHRRPAFLHHQRDPKCCARTRMPPPPPGSPVVRCAQVTFYRQSDVPEVTELTWFLGCLAPYPYARPTHSFRTRWTASAR